MPNKKNIGGPEKPLPGKEGSRKSGVGWTPGPWKAELPSKVWQVNALRANVALAVERRAGNELETEANANLIAAAPELYEALEELSNALEGARAANPEASLEFFEELVEIEVGWRNRVRAVLAKARGEAPAAGAGGKKPVRKRKVEAHHE